jgi:hypothetical protein
MLASAKIVKQVRDSVLLGHSFLFEAYLAIVVSYLYLADLLD